jgi:RimJ/RimL family protein N-acetyltransferase
VFALDGRELYGGVSINQINRDYNFANLGYWIRQSRQRQGLGARAADLMACYGFHRLGLTRLEVVAAEHNVASRAVAEKIGAQFECIARNRLVLHGVPCAAAMYSLVPPWYRNAGPAAGKET